MPDPQRATGVLGQSLQQQGASEPTVGVGGQQAQRDARPHQPEGGIRSAAFAFGHLGRREPLPKEMIGEREVDDGADRLADPVAGHHCRHLVVHVGGQCRNQLLLGHDQDPPLRWDGTDSFHRYDTTVAPSELSSVDAIDFRAVQPRQPAGAAVLRPEKTEAIIAAFFAVLGAKGYEGLTMDRVAERAGVGKAAVYRRWPSKQEMLIDLVGRYATKAVLPPDTGHLRDDLLALANDAIAVLANPLIRSVVQSLVAEAHRSPDLAAVLTERFINPRREAGAKMLRRAVERGEIRPDFDLELAQDLVGGPLYMRGVILGEEFPPGYAERLADAVLRSVGAPPIRR
jgi:AcrR family transcriptional regulator